MSAKYTPSITKEEFDAGASALRSALEKKFEASKADAARPKPSAALAGAFDHVPELDSKTVARWSSTVKDHIGCKIDPNLIRKGGYDSFEDFWNEFAPRLRSTCPDSRKADESSAVEAST